MNINEEAAELLETTADRFATRQYTWAQGDFWNYDGYCAVGGMAKTAGVLRDVILGASHLFKATSGPFGFAARAVSETLGRQLDTTWSVGVAHWNDEEERTVDEVVDLLRHAAKDLRNG